MPHNIQKISRLIYQKEKNILCVNCLHDYFFLLTWVAVLVGLLGIFCHKCACHMLVESRLEVAPRQNCQVLEFALKSKNKQQYFKTLISEELWLLCLYFIFKCLFVQLFSANNGFYLTFLDIVHHPSCSLILAWYFANSCHIYL